MNEVPASIKAPSEPQVNLLPPEVEARRARGRQKSAVAMVFVAFLALLGFGVYWASAQEADAKEALKATVDEGARLQAAIDAYQYVIDIQAELDNARKARTYVGSTEMDVLRVIDDIGAAVPEGTAIDDLTLSVLSIMNVASFGADPFSVPDIGSMTVRGKVPSYVSSAELEEAFNGVPGLARARIVMVQKQDGEAGQSYYVFEGTVRVTALALSGRFSVEWVAVDAINRAVETIGERLSEAEKAVEEAELNDGEPGAVESLAKARADLDGARADHEQVAAFTQLVIDTRNEVEGFQDAMTYGQEGAEEALAVASARLEELAPVLHSLAAAINAWDEEARNRANAEARVEAAERYVDFCQARVEAAEISVASGDEGASEALAGAKVWLAKAIAGLDLEQSHLEDAQEPEAITRSALDKVMAEVSLIASVSSTSGGGES